MRRAHIQDQPATYERLVYKNTSLYHYMRISLQLENESTRLSAAQLKQLICSGLRDLYGESNVLQTSDFPFYLLSNQTFPLFRSLFLFVSFSGLVKLWSALTLLGSYQNELCSFRVTQVSPFLLTLSGNSRELELD
uniref:Ribonuclease P/MRP 14 subunit n=1 Tax=Hucho hucho TaxID=62062 RepID=A0A4W5K6S5_9TELE